MRRRLVFWGPIAAVLAAALAYAFRPQPVPVDLAEVVRGPLAVTIDEEGETRVRDVFVLSAPVAGRAPCMVHFDGLDVTKEIIYAAVADEFRRRGVSLLIVDHPGVGAALRLRGLPSGPDTEKPAGASVDYLETRADVDRNRIGMMALSLGGYYAPRAAAFEKRFKCCVAWGARTRRSA